MKKIFWTTVFWLAIVLIFRGYLRWFDDGLAQNVSNLIGVDMTYDNQGNNANSQELLDQIKSMQTQLDNISQSLVQNGGNQNNLQVMGAQTIKLFYFNQTEDNKLPTAQQLNSSSVLPVERIISGSKNVIEDTINALLEGGLTSEERAKGFITEFPNQDFRLISSNLTSDGTLELIFNEVPGFTSGGSARVFILRSAIEKTAKQFANVKYIKILPETLFQP
ncbi:MAG: GerMN domain-containing protein [Candidatus Absconditicoccaceae bacterium]